MKKILVVSVIFALLLIIKNLTSSIVNISSNGAVMENLHQELSQKQRENEFLTQQLSYVQSDTYAEKEAREKLGMAKPGEYVVIVPEAEKKSSPLLKKQVPIWQKWFDLFFE